jgi:hypothetical protein
MKKKTSGVLKNNKLKHAKSLNSLISRERRKTNFKRILNIKELYYPSWKSFGIVFVTVFIFYICSHLIEIPTRLYFGKVNLVDKLNYLESNHFQNLIAILAGIGAIIFALVIFIAESIRDDDTKDKARVLLKESFLFPLAVAEILTFFIFIWGDINAWSILPIIIIGLLTIYSLARLIIILLNKYEFAKKREELLKERLGRCINVAIDERIANNILLARLNENDIKLDFNIFAGEGDSNCHRFKTDSLGIVSDINLDKLKKIADLIEKEAKKNGFSFKKESEMTPNYGEEREVQRTDSKPYNQLRNRYLKKKFHDPVNDENNVLIYVDNRIIRDNKAIKKIDSLVKQAFIIRSGDNFSDEVRSEIAGVKDQFIVAINNGQTGKIKEFISLYIRLAESFLESIAVFGGGYSSHQASKERHALSGGWEEIRWLSTDIREIVENAMKSRDKSIIGDVAYLPFAIALRAIRFKDHYLFQEFVRFAELIYYHASRENDKELRDFITDRSWRYGKEIASFYVEGKMTKDDSSKEEIISYKEFAIYFYIVFQNLLKRSYENRDINVFEEYKKTTLKLFERFKPSESTHDTDEIKWRLERSDINKEQREELVKALDKQHFFEEIEKDLKLKKYQMLFGLASWILYEFNKNKTDETIKQFYASIQGVFVEKIETFTDLFIKTHAFDVEDYWGWGWWDIKIDEELHPVHTLENLELFYAIKSLSILSSKSEEEIKLIKLPHNRDFAYLVEGTRDLIKILDDISKNADSWRYILSDEAIKKVDSFKYILKVAKENQEQEELEQKRKSRVSCKKVEEFKKDIIKEYYDRAGARSIFKYYGLYQDKMKQDIDTAKERFGINIVDDKAIFFEDWHVYYENWGKNYGRTMANGENASLVDEIGKECKLISENEIDNILSKTTNIGDILILTSNTFMWKTIDDPVKKINNEFFSGWYEYGRHLIPVFSIYSQSHERKILILNKAKLGTLIQQSPLNKGEDLNNIEDIFYMNIKAFSENDDLMEEFIQKQIDWLKQIGNEEKQREHLRELVLIQIYERYRFQKAEKYEGYCIKIKEKNKN